jgi:tetratricopeptide (TPR) repeat protein
MDNSRRRRLASAPPGLDDDGPSQEGPLSAPCRTVFARAGTLAQTPFPALLYKIFSKGLTGVLAVGTRTNHRLVYLLEGEPCWVKARSSEDSVGAILVQTGYVSADDLREVLSKMPERAFLGQALIEANLISPSQLIDVLGQQVYKRLLRLFGLTQGIYEFVDDDRWIARIKSFPQNPIQIIADGVGSRMAANVIAHNLRPRVAKYVTRTEKWPAFSAYYPSPTLGRSFLDAVDGERTVEELTQLAPDRPVDVLRTIWALHLADMVSFSDEPCCRATRPAAKGPAPPPTPLRRVNVAHREPPAPSKQDAQRQPSPLERRVAELYIHVGVMDPHDFFGLDTKASAEDIDLAAGRIKAELPMDEIARLPETLRAKAMELLAAIDHAHQLLRSAVPLQPTNEHKSSGDIWSARPGRAVAGAKAQAHALEFKESAEMEAVHAGAALSFRAARDHCSQKKWQAAYREIGEALRQDPLDPTMETLKIWIVYNLPSDDKVGRHRACLGQMSAITLAHQSIQEAFYYLGRMHEDVRHIDQAYASYQRALALDPRFKPAHRAVARVKNHPLRNHSVRPWWKTLLGLD